MLKQLILAAAVAIMQSNPSGRVTNLEIKNRLRDENKDDPSFFLTQQMVSDMMNDLADENNWSYELNVTTRPGVVFREYFDPTVDTMAAVLGSSSTPAIGYPTNFGPQLDASNGNVVAYVSGQPDKYVQASDRRTARHDAFNAFKGQVPGLDYDNINNCSVEYFNKKYMSSNN
jgi:hypothetical protein